MRLSFLRYHRVEKPKGFTHMGKTARLDMTEGPLLGKIIRYSIPLILTGVLQLLYNAADVVVVGRFAGSEALAAVGSTGALNNLIVNIFLGLSTGVSVLTAQYLGAQNHDAVRKVIHTAVLTALCSGVLVMGIGVSLSKPLLTLMDTPEDVIDLSVLYMRIIFLGMPANLLYNYCAGILRASGDTKHPLLFLSISGLLNVVLNLVLVIVFHLGVAGVAIATIVSQVVSAAFILIYLMRQKGVLHLSLSELRIDPHSFLRIIAIGIPSGLQGACFSISNVLIQSSVNSFGSLAMAGNTAGSNLDGFIYISMNALHHTCMNFTGQNVGAGKYHRIPKVIGYCMAVVTAVGVAVGSLIYLLRMPLLSFYTSGEDAEAVIGYGCMRLLIMATTYFLCGHMEVANGALRGMGESVIPAIISLLGACGFRILWIYTVFRAFHTLTCLYLSFPISWAITAGVQLVMCYFVRKRLIRRAEQHRAVI